MCINFNFMRLKHHFQQASVSQLLQFQVDSCGVPLALMLVAWPHLTHQKKKARQTWKYVGGHSYQYRFFCFFLTFTKSQTSFHKSALFLLSLTETENEHESAYTVGMKGKKEKRFISHKLLFVMNTEITFYRWDDRSAHPQTLNSPPKKVKNIYFCDRGKFKHAPGSLLIWWAKARHTCLSIWTFISPFIWTFQFPFEVESVSFDF